MTRRGWRGTLSKEDRALWNAMAATVTPLHETRPEIPPAAAPAVKNGSPPGEPAAQAPPASPPAPAKPEGPPALAPLDRRTLREIARRADAVEARVDLHGLTQAEAHDRLAGFLRSAQARGVRLVLVITGKGGGDDAQVFAAGERGVLRRVVPHWLTQPDLRTIVLGFSSARPSHGGAGAFYVRLRRRRL